MPVQSCPTTISDCKVSIDLLPSIDLHTGYHRTILEAPPSGYSIQPKNATHVFLFSEEIGSPHDKPHIGEFLEVTDATRLVHVARWPVLNAESWVADTDDLLYPVLCGRTAISESFRRELRGTAKPAFLSTLRHRVENMLTGYQHPSCAGVLLRGHPRDSLDAAMGWFRFLDCEKMGEAFLEKVIPIRPAQIAADATMVRDKWLSPAAMRILFCGRDFECKNGLLALRVMRRIRMIEPSVEFIYVGPIPIATLKAHPELLEGTTHFESLAHSECLKAIAGAHVLFHPARFESIGHILIEAMAAGLAVVTARGERMDYVDELFSTGGAHLLDRSSISEVEEETAFEKLLLDVIRDVELAKSMALRNYSLVSNGEYSIARRNQILSNVYSKADRERHSPLTLQDLPHVWSDNILRMPSLSVSADEIRYRDRNDVQANNVYV